MYAILGVDDETWFGAANFVGVDDLIDPGRTIKPSRLSVARQFSRIGIVGSC